MTDDLLREAVTEALFRTLREHKLCGSDRHALNTLIAIDPEGHRGAWAKAQIDWWDGPKGAT